MLNAPKTTDRDRPGDEKDAKQDSSAEFILELAEAGSANELGTVKAASDAADEKEGESQKRRGSKKKGSAKQ